MRILFIGAVEFSRHALACLLDMHVDVVGVITMERSPFNADHTDLSPLCADYGVPALYASDVNSPEVLEWIQGKRPDVIYCFGWSRLLKRPLLDAAPLGVIGYHPTMLPANRGRHPIIWALALGLRETGSTFFVMGEGADDGDIVSQRRVEVGPHDDARSLYDRLTALATLQIREFTPALADGSLQPIPQNHAFATAWRKRSKVDGEIDWRMSANGIYNLVRALARPYPGAEATINGVVAKLWRVTVVENAPPNAEPGKVLCLDKGAPVVKCGEGAIKILEMEPTLHIDPGCYL